MARRLRKSSHPEAPSKMTFSIGDQSSHVSTGSGWRAVTTVTSDDLAMSVASEMPSTFGQISQPSAKSIMERTEASTCEED